jgi:hypothetical protein
MEQSFVKLANRHPKIIVPPLHELSRGLCFPLTLPVCTDTQKLDLKKSGRLLCIPKAENVIECVKYAREKAGTTLSERSESRTIDPHFNLGLEGSAIEGKAGFEVGLSGYAVNSEAKFVVDAELYDAYKKDCIEKKTSAFQELLK